MSLGKDEKDARIEDLENTLVNVKSGLKSFIPDLFKIHSDDMEITKKESIIRIHELLGGDGWDYSNYGNDELNQAVQYEKMESIADLFIEFQKKNIMVTE